MKLFLQKLFKQNAINNLREKFNAEVSRKVESTLLNGFNTVVRMAKD